MPDMDDPRMLRAMNEMERDMAHLDENKSEATMAHMMRKMKDLMPPGTMPKENGNRHQTPRSRRRP